MATSSSVEQRNVSHLGDLQLRLDVELGRVKMTMAEAGKLNTGDVLVVSGLHTGNYNVFVEGVPFGEGLLSVPKTAHSARVGQLALRMTRLAHPSGPTEVAP